MSRTDLDVATLARSLRAMAGDGSVEWVMEPIQASVLFDIADMLDELELWHRLTAGIELPEYPMTQFQPCEHFEPKDLERENVKLRELAFGIGHLLFSLDVDYCAACPRDGVNHPCPVHTACGGECLYKTDLRELGVEV